MGKKISGFTKIEIAEAGSAFAAPEVIDEENIMDGTQVEVEENEDQTDPTGESPHTGQFANVTIETDDWSIKAAIDAFRTADAEKRVDVRVTLVDGTTTITLEGGRAKTHVDVKSDAGQANTWIMESRMFTTDQVDFD